jgi:3-methyladenine DNA glycosylase AlkD
MATRYGIHTKRAFCVSMADMKALARRLERHHGFAGALWETGWYEARVVASMVDEPALVTPEQMDRWCRDFDSWAICDTVCFNLFDRSPHAWPKVEQWSGHPDEFVKRGAFALLWSLALHDKKADDHQFVEGLELIERQSIDDRPLVRKSLCMALRAIAARNPRLNAAALETARRLSESPSPAARWVGKTSTRRKRQLGS